MNYTVQPGDNLSKIAQRFLGDARRFPVIAAANGLGPPYAIAVGMTLTIPDTGATTGGGTTAANGVSVVTHAVLPHNAISETRLANVHPQLATRVRAMIDLLAQRGTSILITQGLRTWEEQDALYAKGRTVAPIGNKFIVTKAKGGQSYHNFGLAVDIVILDSIGKADWDTSHPGWSEAADAGKSVGLEWGGDWASFKDLPHFQYTGKLSLGDCRTLYAKNGIPSVWGEVA